ncbi:MAG: chemotaxis protein CheW [Labilithrix sp.]|nr:chemotaxis protein CheW [Labilithrix sp.]
MSASRSAGDAPTTRQLCTFSVDGLLFGVDVTNVQEVLRHLPMTAVPLAPATVRGLINLRGEIVTAIDVRVRLGLPPRPAELTSMNVVATTNGGTVSLLVDEIGDVIEVDDQSFEKAPATMNVTLRDAVVGVFKLEERLLLLLDAEKVAALGSMCGSKSNETTTREP